MKLPILCIVFSLIYLANITAQDSCLSSENLKALDQSWEQAFLKSDISYLEKLLAEDFVWVHNHASMVETKSSLIERIEKANPSSEQKMISRNSNNVKVIQQESTGVVTGFTVVSRSRETHNYNFMRTYFQVDGQCFLLSNHTMQIPKTEE